MTRPKALDAVVIGAGAAGLSAARTLVEGGLSVVVLEARRRAGGRILTRRDVRAGGIVELGAEFDHGRSDEVARAAKEAGTPLVLLPDVRVHANGGRRRILEGFWAKTHAMTRALDVGRRDRTFSDAYRSVDGLSRRDAFDFVSGFQAADPSRVSARAIRADGEDPGPGDFDQLRPRDGYGALVAALERRVRGAGVRLVLGATALEVAWSKRGVAVTARVGRAARTFRARAVVVTLPVGVLKARPPASGAVVFTPEIPALTRALPFLEMGLIVKIVLVFEGPFWNRPKELSSSPPAFFHVPGSPFQVFWTSAPVESGLVTAWAGGPKANPFAEISLEQRGRIALSTFARALGMRPSSVSRRLVRVHQKDWSKDPFARGAYAWVAAGGLPALAGLRRSGVGGVFFAGEALAEEETGTVGGALADGRRAARRVLSKLSR